MGNKGRKSNAITYLYGEKNEWTVPVKTVKVKTCDEITRGDLMYLNLSTTTGSSNRFAYPIGPLASASVGDRAHLFFLGVSESDSKDGDSDAIRVATDGVFEIPLNTATTIKPGYDAILVTGVGVGSASIDVDAVSAAAPSPSYKHVIGRIVEAGTSATTAKVKIHSSIAGGSIDWKIPTT
jgi:predicted RecA/RadA family phage recombinase